MERLRRKGSVPETTGQGGTGTILGSLDNGANLGLQGNDPAKSFCQLNLFPGREVA